MILNSDKFNTESMPAEVIIKFKENEFFLVIRRKQFSNIDFLSYCGGFLGLFAGISVLSIIELFYYFTIRVIVDLWRAWRSCKVFPVGPMKSCQKISIQKIHQERITRSFNNYILQYFKQSSIHGCNHSVDTSRSLLERLT